METRVREPVAAMRKSPRQRRSQAMVALIVEAAARVLAHSGWARFTTNAVAEAAGISVGSLYQYFPNKLALAEAIRCRHLDEVLAVLGRSGEPSGGSDGADPLTGRVARMIDGIVAVHQVDPSLHRVLLDEVPLSGRTMHEDFERSYARLYEDAVAEALGPNSRHAALVSRILSSAVEGVVHEAARRGELGAPEVRRELQRLVRSYLDASRGASEPTASHPNRRPSAVKL